MTPLLCVLVSRPGRGCRSSTHVVKPRAAMARAPASPVTPPPITATSICSTPDTPNSAWYNSTFCYGKTSADYRYYRTGRVVSRGAAAREGLRGVRHVPAPERAEQLAHRTDP